MKKITPVFALIFFFFMAIIACQKQENPAQPNATLNCIDSFEGSNDALATAPFISDFAATERASLFAKDKDYWQVSVKTGTPDKLPIYLSVKLDGSATVKITASTSATDVFSTILQAGENNTKRLYIGALPDHKTVTLLFEQLSGEPVCYDFCFDMPTSVVK